MSAVVPLARVMTMSPAMFERSISPLAPMLTLRVMRSVWRLALVAAALALLREGGRGRRDPPGSRRA